MSQATQVAHKPLHLSSFSCIHRPGPSESHLRNHPKIRLFLSKPRTGPSSECGESAQREPPAALQLVVSTILLAANQRSRQKPESISPPLTVFAAGPSPPRAVQRGTGLPQALHFSLFWRSSWLSSFRVSVLLTRGQRAT